mmetsp:Transcript_20100/g.33859  ORF Transcript_20100/g.33859 Transcript_20100/m.33859 type:complete len:409 (-) Transcript_20100:221-1447(-)
MLARFAALEKKAKEEVRQEKEEKEREEEAKRLKEEDDKQYSDWMSKANTSSSPSKRHSVKIHETVIKTVDKADLVWAPLHIMKGPSSLAMARVCEFGEAAFEEYIAWPIPEDSVLVEFICVPQNLSRFSVIAPTKGHTAQQRCLPYNSPLHRGKRQGTIEDAFRSKSEGETVKSGEDRWDPDRMEELYKAYKDKYSAVLAKQVMSNCRKVANEFLKRALEKKKLEAGYAQDREKAEEDSRESFASASDSDAHATDLTKYALQKASSSEGQRKGESKREARKRRLAETEAKTLSAGDFIGYACKIFKERRRSQIIRIDKGGTLKLANDDVIYSSDLVVKLSGGTEEGGEQKHGSMPLSDYTLQSGSINVESIQEVMSRQTKADLRLIQKETGVSINNPRKKKSKSSSST